MSDNIVFNWTDGSNQEFQEFYRKTEEYYSKIVGGIENRRAFVPYNHSDGIPNVLIAYIGDVAVACAGFKLYSNDDAEIKRVWVESDYRGRHIAKDLMKQIEDRAREFGYKRTILQTRAIMEDAVGLYEKLGYSKIENYPPYDNLDGAVCMAKEL